MSGWGAESSFWMTLPEKGPPENWLHEEIHVKELLCSRSFSPASWKFPLLQPNMLFKLLCPVPEALGKAVRKAVLHSYEENSKTTMYFKYLIKDWVYYQNFMFCSIWVVCTRKQTQFNNMNPIAARKFLQSFSFNAWARLVIWKRCQFTGQATMLRASKPETQ